MTVYQDRAERHPVHGWIPTMSVVVSVVPALRLRDRRVAALRELHRLKRTPRHLVDADIRRTLRDLADLDRTRDRVSMTGAEAMRWIHGAGRAVATEVVDTTM